MGELPFAPTFFQLLITFYALRITPYVFSFTLTFTFSFTSTLTFAFTFIFTFMFHVSKPFPESKTVI